MLYFILASHSQLAYGMKKTIKMLTGVEDNVTAYDLQEDGDVGELSKKVHRQVDDLGNSSKIIILTDIPGGSVNNNLIDLAQKPNVYLVTGMNLPIVLSLVMEREINKPKLLQLVAEARGNLKLIDDEILEASKTKDDDFFD